MMKITSPNDECFACPVRVVGTFELRTKPHTMTFFAPYRAYFLLPLLAFGLVMGGCNTDDDDPDDIDPTKQWELMGAGSIGSHPSNGGLYANNGNA